MISFGKIAGKEIYRSGTAIILGEEEFEFAFENVTFAVQFVPSNPEIEHKAYAKKISETKMKFFFYDVNNTSGLSATFQAGSTPDGPLVIRFFIHAVGAGATAQRLLNYVLMLDPKAS